MNGTSVVIPGKGTSTRIPRKNLVDFRGRPLILWSIEYAQSEGFQPWVITDDVEIRDYALRCGARVLDEPPHIAAEPTTIPVMKWAAGILLSDIIELFPTTPIRRPGLVNEAIEKLKTHDSVVSACRLPNRLAVDGTGGVLNGDVLPSGGEPTTLANANDSQFIWSGALCAMKYPQFLDAPSGVFGRVAIIEEDFRKINNVILPQDLIAPSVVVVGNASNLRERELGWLIDGYDVVVRLNWGQVTGWEARVGRKTTHWAIVCSPYIVAGFEQGNYEGELRTDCSPFVAVWPRYGGHDGSYERCLSHLKGWKQLERICGWDDSIRNFARWNTDRKRLPTPTTGIVAIAKSIDKWGIKVDVAGFGQREEVHRGYYCGRDFATDGCHNLDAERLLLNDWESDSLIRRIDQ